LIDRRAPVIARSELSVSAPASVVWSLLGDPTGWPSFDAGVRDVELDGPVAPDGDFCRRQGGLKIRARFAL
jgi:hypothetical protein